MTIATGIILAGGQARRMGGADKGLQPLHGRPLAAWVLDRLAPQVDEVLINANRHPDRYAALGARVVADATTGHAGPLAGVQRGLMEARHALVLVVPCDAPRLPLDLASRLAQPLCDPNLDASVARAGGRLQPVFCMARRALLPHLTAFLEGGGRKVDAWLATLRTATVDFEDAAAFANVNSIDDLRALEAAGQAPPASRR
ncbi:MAG TPA: molybdenum cofactor guanylyltransferase MobA [Burkholderiales bacterium]|jgi:molybdopterin-guanine dinucleotide biosynthesis protein A|nr:molybdenum cofactor guanylyltransferase MobA [Burkholderiales bacterium]